MTQILGLPRLRELREAKGMTMEELAKAVGVSRQAVCYWEIGQRSPALLTAAKVAEVLGIEFGELLGIGGETPQPCAAAPLERGAEEMIRQMEEAGL